MPLGPRTASAVLDDFFKSIELSRHFKRDLLWCSIPYDLFWLLLTDFQGVATPFDTLKLAITFPYLFSGAFGHLGISHILY